MYLLEEMKLLKDNFTLTFPLFGIKTVKNENDLLNAEIRRGTFLKTLKIFQFLDVETNCNNILNNLYNFFRNLYYEINYFK